MSSPSSMISSPTQALRNHRDRIVASRQRILALYAAVNSPADFALYQWAQIEAFALDFQPDVIIELGRGAGNSTCCFIEVANALREASMQCRVLSVCRSDQWRVASLPRLQQVVPSSWFACAEIVEGDIIHYDYAVAADATRCLVFWDAHGFEIAECVLGKILPRLVGKPHVVVMHDMSDGRYLSEDHRQYGDHGLWKGKSATSDRLWLGHIVSDVAQAISIVDFCTRNGMPLHSATESFYTELKSDVTKLNEMKRLLGEEFFSQEGSWMWFTLDEAVGSLAFPRFTITPPTRPAQ